MNLWWTSCTSLFLRIFAPADNAEYANLKKAFLITLRRNKTEVERGWGTETAHIIDDTQKCIYLNIGYSILSHTQYKKFFLKTLALKNESAIKIQKSVIMCSPTRWFDLH